MTTRWWLLALLLASLPCTGAPLLQVVYPGPLPASQVWIDASGFTLRAHDAQGALQWTYAVQQSAAGGDCDGQLWPATLLQDADGNGRIEASRGERARLLLALNWPSGGRQRSAVVALDLSTPGPPRELWRRDDQQLPQLANLVVAPTPARLRIANLNRDPAQWVVLLGAGLPRAAAAGAGARDGAQLLALDAQDGRTLWRAGGPGSGADQVFGDLRHALGGAITALDTHLDGQTDRLYLGDWNAGLWRIDLLPGASPAQLARAGRLAQLDDPLHPLARGLLAAPDISLMREGARQWFNVAVGSVATGLGTPGNQALFVVRDLQPFTTLTQRDFEARDPIRASDLPIPDDVASTVTDTRGPGWQWPLGSGQVLTRSLTLGGVLLFVQQLSPGPGLTASCRPAPLRIEVAVGALAVRDGLPVIDLDGDGRRSTSDRAVLRLVQGSDRPALQASPPAEDPLAPGCQLDGQMLAGCPPLPPPRQLYWRRHDVD